MSKVEVVLNSEDQVKMGVFNCTPHDIKVLDKNESKVYVFKSTGNIVRVDLECIEEYDNDVFSFRQVVPRGLLGLPDEKIYSKCSLIVSAMVLRAVGDVFQNLKLLSPDTDKGVRNEKGHIMYVPGFVIR